MKDMLTDSSGTMQLLMDNIITHRFDLITFAIGLVGYIVLNSIRRNREVNGFHKKIGITFEASEVIDTKQGTDAASEELSASEELLEVLASLGHCDDADVFYAADELQAFLNSYPTYQFTLREVDIILSFCSRFKDTALANNLLEHMQPTEEWSILSAFIRFYTDNQQSEKACDLFELNYATFFDIELDESMALQLLMAALKCGRQSLAEHLLETSQSDIGRHVVTIQQWWKGTAAKLGESRVAHMGEVLNRLSNVFNAQFPFEEEHSDDESTAFLGDDSDREVDCDSDYSGGDYDETL